MSDPVAATANAPDTSAEAPLNDIVDDVAADTVPQKGADQTPPFDVKALTDRALHFLATASNETLGACLVGLGAGTYLILGRVGLVLIGVVGGVVLHATWEGQSQSSGDAQQKGKISEARKRELGTQVASRILDWRDKKEKQDGDADSSDLSLKLYSGKQLDYSEFKPETAAALTELTDAVIRDYVKYVLELPHTSLSNMIQMVVFTHSACRRCFPQFVPPNPDCVHALRIRTPLPQATCRQLRRLCDALVLIHDYSPARAVSRHHGITW